MNPERIRRLAAELHERLRRPMRERWDRDLPLAELLFDRWERARSLGFGEESSVYHLAYFYGDVSVGRKTWIGPYTLIDGSGGGVRIGDFCVISAGVHIYTHDTVAWAVSGGSAPFATGAVAIGDRCYIGSQSVIARGVTIGAGSVVGANSFVNRDIPPGTIAVGSPCRPVGRVIVDGDDVRFDYDEAAPPNLP